MKYIFVCLVSIIEDCIVLVDFGRGLCKAWFWSGESWLEVGIASLFRGTSHFGFWSVNNGGSFFLKIAKCTFLSKPYWLIDFQLVLWKTYLLTNFVYFFQAWQERLRHWINISVFRSSKQWQTRNGKFFIRLKRQLNAFKCYWLKGCAGKYRPLQFYLLLIASNQAGNILKQLFKELSFQKNWIIKRNAAAAAFLAFEVQHWVGHSYKPLLLSNKFLQFFWSCDNNFYVLIGSTIFQLSM